LIEARGSRTDAKARIVSSKPASTSDKAPDLRVIVSGVEIGAAWRRTSKGNRSYHSAKLDDPSFTAPIYANIFEGDDATGEEIRALTPASTAGRRYPPSRLAMMPW
jgi:uncharacterized protein (DUF736 family)